MIGMIAAVTQNGVIGVENKLPFDYPADMKHFRTTTANATVIMGRKTFEGIGRPLPKRTNIIVTSQRIEYQGAHAASSLQSAILAAPLAQDIWLIGGASIYEEGMEFADKIVLTITPDIELRKPAVRFPWINPRKFAITQTLRLAPEDPSLDLHVVTYEKITG